MTDAMIFLRKKRGAVNSAALKNFDQHLTDRLSKLVEAGLATKIPSDIYAGRDITH